MVSIPEVFIVISFDCYCSNELKHSLCPLEVSIYLDLDLNLLKISKIKRILLTLATFQELNSHTWLVVTVLNRTEREHTAIITEPSTGQC